MVFHLFLVITENCQVSVCADPVCSLLHVHLRILFCVMLCWKNNLHSVLSKQAASDEFAWRDEHRSVSQDIGVPDSVSVEMM